MIRRGALRWLPLCCGAALAWPAAQAAQPAASLATSTEAVAQLVAAVQMDVATEATLQGCDEAGAASTPALRQAWVAWRERYRLAPLRAVVMDMSERAGRAVNWDRQIDTMRQRVLAEADPAAACSRLAADLGAPAMDPLAANPQAVAVARELVQRGMAKPPPPVALAPGRVQGEVLQPSQLPALAARRGQWHSLSAADAQQRLGRLYVRGRVERHPFNPQAYALVQQDLTWEAPAYVVVEADLGDRLGREGVFTGVVTTLTDDRAVLADVAWVQDASALTPSALPAAALTRRPVALRRVMAAPGRGLPLQDLAAVVVRGQASYVNGTRWEEHVRFLLRDGTAYQRTEMPPDQLDVAASRRLEPQHWLRWKSTAKGYELQAQDAAAARADGQKEAPFQPVQPWPQGAWLAGSYGSQSFTGSGFTGGTSRSESWTFTREGRFERSVFALSSTGTLQAGTGTVIAGSSHGDGKGSTQSGSATVSTGVDSSVGTATGRRRDDDGASRRGRYTLAGYTVTLDFDDGHQERWLSFPMDAQRSSVYLGHGSFDRDKK